MTPSLTRYAWLSIGAAIVTIALKAGAWALTGSVGLLSDALESIVNLVAALVALVALSVAAQPADEEHPHGHEKAEYLSSGTEGALILIAALGILAAAARRLISPTPLVHLGLGVAISGAAAVLNLVVARVLLHVGRRHRSITLEADGQHLMTDGWTSVGVLAGVGAVALTGWWVLDPLLAIVVGLWIVRNGVVIVRRSIMGLLDAAIPKMEQQNLIAILDSYRDRGVRWHALRTRQAGTRCFVSVHVLVPGEWSVKRGHDLLEEIEAKLRKCLGQSTIFTHLEPVEDEVSYRDIELDRVTAPTRPSPRSSAPRSSDAPPEPRPEGPPAR